MTTHVPPERIDRWRAVRVEAWSTKPIVLAVGARIHGYAGTGQKIEELLTTAVVRIDGRVVTTASGSRYELGAPDPEYDQWLEARGVALDTTRPAGSAIAAARGR